MKKVKLERLNELSKFGFEFNLGIWKKRFRRIDFNVHDDGVISLSTYHFFMNDYIEEITDLSNRIMYDRNDVQMELDNLEEKEMLENE